VFLEGLRGILALLVVFCHGFIHLVPGGQSFPLLLANGFRVPAFFALSGFVLYYGSAADPEIRLRRAFGDLLRRRAWRLLPAYYASLVIFTLLAYATVLLGKADARVIMGDQPQSLLWHFLMLHSWMPSFRFSIIASCWMMGYEWYLSLLLPAFLWVARRWGWAALLGGSLLLLAPGVATLTRGLLPPSLTVSFLLGIAAARLARRRPAGAALITLRVATAASARPPLCRLTARSLSALAAVMGAAGFLVLRPDQALYLRMDFPAARMLPEAFAGLTTAAMCLWLSYQRQGVLGRLLTTRPLVWLGGISYSLFLIHQPLFVYWSWFLARYHLGAALGYAALILVIPPLCLVSAAFHRLFEAPFMRGHEWRGGWIPGGARSEPAPLVIPVSPTGSARSVASARAGRG
jgi:peptidoglycan/LPS O-acetylase OafA/YrhL